MLRSLVGKSETALLRQALFMGVLGIFKSLDFHTDILQKLRISTKAFNKDLL